LNCLLEGEHHITDLHFLDKEQPGDPVQRQVANGIPSIALLHERG
jgi:hypothetical protein